MFKEDAFIILIKRELALKKKKIFNLIIIYKLAFIVYFLIMFSWKTELSSSWFRDSKSPMRNHRNLFCIACVQRRTYQMHVSSVAI